MTHIPKKLIVVFLIAWALLVFRVDAPFTGGQARVWIPAAARNYQIYGLENTRLMVIRNESRTTPENFNYYSHHPPTLVWMPALTTLALGTNEIGVRFGFISVSLVSVAAMYLLARRLYGQRVAFWAAAFYAVLPIIAYYGRIPGYAQLVLAASLLFAAALVNWLRHPTRPRLVALVALAWLVAWTDWDAVFIAWAVGFVALRLATSRQRAVIVGLGMVTLAGIVTLLVVHQLQWSGSFDSLMNVFSWRSSNASYRADDEPFTVGLFLAQNLYHMVTLLTLPFLIMAVWGLVSARKYGNRFGNTILFGLLLGPLAYFLVFRNATFVHNYYKSILAPPFALAAAIAFTHARDDRRIRRLARPFFDGMVIGMVISCGYVFFILHRQDYRPWLVTSAEAITQYATPEDTVLTNLTEPVDAASVAFYTERDVIGKVTPEDAIARAESNRGRVFYLYCQPERETLPEALRGYDTAPVVDDKLQFCVLFFVD